MIVRVNSKGYITIPAGLRGKFGIQPGTRFLVTEDGVSIFLTPMTGAGDGEGVFGGEEAGEETLIEYK